MLSLFCCRLTGCLDCSTMPARRAFCWCIGRSAPPEISYEISAVNGGMTLKPIALDLPMPEDEVELNAKFTELVVS